MRGAFLRRRDRTARPLRVEHYSDAVNMSAVRTIARARATILRLPGGYNFQVLAGDAAKSGLADLWGKMSENEGK